MNEKIAIDVVLLLPQAINNICMEVNKKSDTKKYVSFKDGYKPHITLGMGSILTGDLAGFKKELSTTVKDVKIPEITITSLNGFEDNTYYFNLAVSKSLRSLHTKVFDLVSKRSAGDIVKENLYKVSKKSGVVDYVNNFKKNSAHKKYHPHITLGKDVKGTSVSFPIKFKPTSIALFQIGIHGTCKNLLTEYKLN